MDWRRFDWRTGEPAVHHARLSGGTELASLPASLIHLDALDLCPLSIQRKDADCERCKRGPVGGCRPVRRSQQLTFGSRSLNTSQSCHFLEDCRSEPEL